MGIKVTKFGGSSVADAIQIDKIKGIIDADADRRFVVVSAPGKRFAQDSKITDLLYSCHMHMQHNLPYEQLFQVICDRYRAVELNLGIHAGLTVEFAKIREKLDDGTATPDYLASRGEFLNGKIIAAYIGYDFIDAADVVLFDKKGRFLETKTNDRLKEELSKHDKALIPGFYGATEEGEIKTFSRGGSDITGALVARAIEANVYENWTDVSGFLMADPRIVPEAKPIKEVSYKELRELSYMGASVLHEDAIYPARVSNIPINIRNTNKPEDLGTLITAESDKNPDRVITGIAGSKDFTVIALYKNRLTAEKGFIRRLAGVLEDFDIDLEHMPSGIDNVSVVLSDDQIDGRIDELVEEFKRQLQPDTIDVFDDVALIATVGAGMSSRRGVSARLFTALADNDVNIRMIDQGSSEMNIIVGVQNTDFERAIKVIYEAFEK
ncbi:MAG: aspartate kinase [Anaerovoracaceae bacterium]